MTEIEKLRETVEILKGDLKAAGRCQQGGCQKRTTLGLCADHRRIEKAEEKARIIIERAKATAKGVRQSPGRKGQQEIREIIKTAEVKVPTAEVVEHSPVKTRGRPRKSAQAAEGVGHSLAKVEVIEELPPLVNEVKRGRGRPRKM